MRSVMNIRMAIYSYSLCVTYLDTLEDIYVAYFLVGHSCKAPHAPMSDVSIVIMSHVTSPRDSGVAIFRLLSPHHWLSGLQRETHLHFKAKLISQPLSFLRQDWI